MNVGDVMSWVMATVQGALVGAVVLLVIFIGACFALDLLKLRHPGRSASRSLEERVGESDRGHFLPPSPRGPIDQLKAGTTGGHIA